MPVHDDLDRWSACLDGVDVVGLGEATHGTAEFFTLKHRLIEYLVEARGTTVVAFEASEAAAVAVDDWVAGGPGDGRELLAGLGFWVWNTREVLDLLRGLRRTNDGRPAARRVRFVGVDPQRPGAAVTAVADHLAADGHARRADAVRAVTEPAAMGTAALSPAALGAVREALAVAAEGAPAGLVGHAAHVARSALLAATGDALAFCRERDRLMATALLRLAADHEGPVAFWGHNGHVGCGRAEVTTTGAHLRDVLGDAYYALGLLAGDGTFRARRGRGPFRPTARPRVVTLGTAPPTTVEGRLLAEHPGDQLVDLRRVAAGSWLHKPGWTRSHGAVAPPFAAAASTPVLPAAEFDGLAVLGHTSPSTPVRAVGRSWLRSRGRVVAEPAQETGGGVGVVRDG